MANHQVQAVVVEALLADAYDGATRLLLDAQRFGLSLLSFSMAVGSEGIGKVTLKFEWLPCCDLSSIVSRMARHPAVMELMELEHLDTDAIGHFDRAEKIPVFSLS